MIEGINATALQSSNIEPVIIQKIEEIQGLGGQIQGIESTEEFSAIHENAFFKDNPEVNLLAIVNEINESQEITIEDAIKLQILLSLLSDDDKSSDKEKLSLYTTLALLSVLF